jgi:hypothetical protein
MDYGRLVVMLARRQIQIRTLNPITVSEDIRQINKQLQTPRCFSGGGENRELLGAKVGSLIPESSNSQFPAGSSRSRAMVTNCRLCRVAGPERETKKSETKRC